MRAVRTLEAVTLSVPMFNRRRPDTTVALLQEIVAELAERVELLETRERVGRAGTDLRNVRS